MTISAQMKLYANLLRMLEFAEADGNFSTLATAIDSIIAGTAGGETRNAVTLGGVAAGGYSPIGGPGSSGSFTTGPLYTSGMMRVTGIDGILAVHRRDTNIYACGWYSAAGELSLDTASSGLAFKIETNGAVIIPGTYAATTASASNLFVDSTGKFYRSTSSERFKADIEPLAPEYADKLLSAQPIWYRSLCNGDNPEWSYYGLSAEKLAEIDPRYVFWSPQYKTVTELIDELVPVTESVTIIEESIEIKNGQAILIRTTKPVDQQVYDEYPLFDQAVQPIMVEVAGKQQQAMHRQPRMTTRSVPHDTRVVDETLPMIPDGVQYERLTVALLSIVQRQQIRLDALEGR